MSAEFLLCSQDLLLLGSLFHTGAWTGLKLSCCRSFFPLTVEPDSQDGDRNPGKTEMEMFYRLAGCGWKFPRDQRTFPEWTKVSEEFEKVLDGTFD